MRLSPYDLLSDKPTLLHARRSEIDADERSLGRAVVGYQSSTV
jgi:hypothetical protein